MQRTDILVVGAGPAGLTTAYMLAKAGRDVTVIERDPIYVGGISRTVDYKGFLFDIGGHRFFSKSKEVVALWDEILPDDFIARPRLSRIFYRGKFYSYPLKAFEALRNLGLLQSAACMASFAWPKPSPSKIPKPFTIGCATSSASGCSRSSSRPTPKRCGGCGCDEISADWAAQRIKGLSLGAAILDALRRSLGRKRKNAGTEDGPKTLIESLSLSAPWSGMMWEAAAKKMKAMGGRILMDHALERLTYDEARALWTIEVMRGDGTRETFVANEIVSSAPIRELMSALKPTPISVFCTRAS